MTHVLAPAATDPPASRWTALRSCLAALCLTVGLSATASGWLLTAFDDPAGAVRGKVNLAQFAQLASNGWAVAPFYLHAATTAERDRAVRCLTNAIYYEAGQEPLEGQRAIAQVVINRVRDRHFPKSVCGVVYEGWDRRTGCQFSFVCDGSISRRRADPAVWDRLRPLAYQALNGYVTLEIGTATHYHAAYVRPNWIRSVAQITAVGSHVFYRWKGRAGLPSALRGAYEGGEFRIADRALDGGPSLIPTPQDSRRHGPTATSVRGSHQRSATIRLASIRSLRGRSKGGRLAGRGSMRLT